VTAQITDDYTGQPIHGPHWHVQADTSMGRDTADFVTWAHVRDHITELLATAPPVGGVKIDIRQYRTSAER